MSMTVRMRAKEGVRGSEGQRVGGKKRYRATTTTIIRRRNAS
jgi:hypothetical protein